MQRIKKLVGASILASIISIQPAAAINIKYVIDDTKIVINNVRLDHFQEIRFDSITVANHIVSEQDFLKIYEKIMSAPNDKVFSF